MDENLIVRMTHFALHLFSQYVGRGDSVIDGTAGNGSDTLAMAELVGADSGNESGTVYSFDIQQVAIEHTARRLKEHGITYRIISRAGDLPERGIMLIHAPHEKIKCYVKENIAGAIFNLGYMPGQDKTFVTKPESTISAVSQALELLKKNGVVVVVIYAGHEGGAEEKEMLLAYAAQLDAGLFHVAHIGMINQPDAAPSLLLITKKKE